MSRSEHNAVMKDDVFESGPVERAPLDTFQNVLRAVLQKPGFYLAGPGHTGHSIELLQTFIHGYEMGRSCPDDTSVLSAFTWWVCLRYRVRDETRNWASLLLEQSAGDGEAAYESFTELFDDYLKDLETDGADGIEARYLELMEELGA